METKGIQQIMNSYSVKMIIVSGLAILLLIPSFLIQELISERMAANDAIKSDLYVQWGGPQVISGPVLNIPYTVEEPGENNEANIQRRGIAHFLPENLKTEGVIFPEIRKRSIYRVVVYEGKIHITGSFDRPDVSLLEIPNAQFHYNAAYFTVGISEVRGIKNQPQLTINDQRYPVEPGVADTDIFPSGVTIKAGSVDLTQRLHFSIELHLNGSEKLFAEALGKTSTVSFRSDWNDPGFIGQFLPAQREVTENGFSADWQVTHLNRNFPQQWIGPKYKTEDAVVGVELLIPVDHYQKSMRSAKYAILFIALNFITFLFIEIKSRKRIHPFQYSLVAFALLIFYVLLIALGEQIGFNPAYILSAAAVTALISWYTMITLQNRRLTGWVTLLQSGLYLFLFAVLQLKDYALLAGSIGLFIILAVIMYASKQIKWYPEG